MIRLLCPQCGKAFERAAGHVKRSRSIGAPLYCGMACAGLARRRKNPPTETERKAAKKAYNAQYRLRDPDALKDRKAAYYQRTRDPVKEAVERKKHMPRHVEYCRRPDYRVKKAAYDRRLGSEQYGAFADAHTILMDLERELRKQATKYERMKQKGYFTRNAQKRRRELWQLMQSRNSTPRI